MAARHEQHSGDRTRACTIRRASVDDEAGLTAFYASLTRRSLKCRFHCEMNGLPASHVQQLSRLARLDARQVQSFVALEPTSCSAQTTRLIGHAGWCVDGDSSAEFALVVADAHQGHGLGPQLLQALIRSAQQQGLQQLHAYVLRDNTAMLRMLRRAGIAVQSDPEDSSLVRACIAPQSYQPPLDKPETRPATAPWWAGCFGWFSGWSALSARGVA